MPPGRKPTRSREEFVDAAIAFADEHGISALTLRALGSALGASTTAVYRYFDDKDDLILAMREDLLESVVASPSPLPADPAGVVIAVAHAYRAIVRKHPCLSQIMRIPVAGGPAAANVQLLLLDQLAALGLEGATLARGYQQLESFVIGTSMFDFSDAPRHLTDRSTRFAALERAELPVTEARVEANNEAAFDASLQAILDSLVAAQAAAALVATA